MPSFTMAGFYYMYSNNCHVISGTVDEAKKVSRCLQMISAAVLKRMTTTLKMLMLLIVWHNYQRLSRGLVS